MSSATKTWIRRLALALLVLLAAYLLWPFLISGLRAGVSAIMAVLSVLAYLLAAVALPIGLYALLRFGYRVFARPYIRLRRIQRIRDARYLREAARRGRFKVIVNPHRANSDQRPSPPTAEP